MDFRTRISGLETNPFTLYWARPRGLWPNEFPPSPPPASDRRSMITRSRRPEQGNAVCSLLSGEISGREPLKARYDAIRLLADEITGDTFINVSMVVQAC